jgi:hypothetical protein
MKKIIILFLSVLSLSPLSAQDTGFTFTMEEGGVMPTTMIETADGYLLAVSNRMQNTVRWMKLSHSGEIMEEKIIEQEGAISVSNIFADPDNDSRYYVLLQLYGNRLHIQHIDQNLNVLDTKEITIPASGSIDFVKALLNRNGKIVATMMDVVNHSSILNNPNITAQISLDGELEKIVVDSTLQGPDGDICEIPNHDNSYWIYKIWNVGGLSNMVIKDLDADFNSSILCDIKQKSIIYGDTTYIVSPFSTANSSIYPLSDSVLLVADRCGESYISQYGGVLASHRSSIVYKTNLNGEILDFFCVGSGDPDEFYGYPAFFDALAAVDSNTFYLASFDIDLEKAGLGYLVVTKFTGELEVIWQKSFQLGNPECKAIYTMATSDGGCLVCGVICDPKTPVQNSKGMFVLKLNGEGLLAANEFVVPLESEVSVFPNPGGEVFYVQTQLEDAEVEVCNMLGHQMTRLVLDGKPTSISAQSWPAGLYLWQVLKDGRVLERGKWMKNAR